MCTAISLTTKDHYFGRNLDYEYSYRETVTITPRNYIFPFRRLPPMEHHYALIGMATVAENYPLYYDATNEYGLSIAGLNFPHSAKYMPQRDDKDNVTPFELIPWLLGNCKNIDEAKKNNVIVSILIEVNIAEEDSKFGIHKDETIELVKEISQFENIRIMGLMTIAPYVENPEDNREYFKAIKELSVDIDKQNIDNVSMSVLSMGMTGDYTVAIEEGATCVRVGTGIFGERIYNI